MEAVYSGQVLASVSVSVRTPSPTISWMCRVPREAGPAGPAGRDGEQGTRDPEGLTVPAGRDDADGGGNGLLA